MFWYIKAFRHIFSNTLKKLLTNSLVLSRFDYGDTVYGNFINKSEQNRIQKIQNFCIRYIYNICKLDLRSHKFAELGWLPMAKRRKVHFCSFIYKVMKTGKPEHLFSRLNPRSTLHTVEIRSKRNLHIPRHRTTLFQKGFTYKAAKYFNTLVRQFLDLPVGLFKKRIKHFFAINDL